MTNALDPSLQKDALNLLAAVLLGGAVGFERQWRQRFAGLRTNTLVALGAAIYVVFASQFPDESPTRVAAQVVSGIGFLGAGVIFKEGLNVRGLNTAATLWCSGAIGILAGAGQYGRGAAAAALIIFVNLAMRPLVALIDRQPIESAEVVTSYLVTVICKGAAEADIRALLLQGFSEGLLHLHGLESADIEGGGDRVEVSASLASDSPRDIALETIVGQLSLDPRVTAARWRTVTALE
jgi:putative Mg2+ transporter-C (MgtC) family protein